MCDRFFISDPFRMSSNFPKLITKPARVRIKLADQKIREQISSPVVIKGSNLHFYHRLNQTYNKFKPLRLISAAWHKNTKNGDYFSILPHRPNKSTPRKLNSFETFGLSAKVISALLRNSFRWPTEIQQLSFPAILKRERHAAIFASTGSGKTLAYLTPIMQSIVDLSDSETLKKPRNPICVILVPTNELCNQVHDLCLKFSDLFNSAHVHSEMTPLEVIRVKEVVNEVVVGTPEGLTNVVKKGLIKFNQCRFLVIDESDSLLDNSFYPTIQQILSQLVLNDTNHAMLCKLVFCGATLPKNLDDILESYTGSNGEHLQMVQGSSVECVMGHVKHDFYRLAPSKVLLAIRSLLHELVRKPGNILIFCNSSSSVRKLSFFLQNEGFKHEAVYGDVDKHYRKNVMNLLRDGFVKVLISTDVISRGFDTSNVSYVINYDCPYHMSDYVHRAGKRIEANIESRQNEHDMDFRLNLTNNTVL